MRTLLFLFQFLLFVLQCLHVACFATSPTHPLCPHDQKHSLLQFKQTMKMDAIASIDCKDYGPDPYPKMKSWSESSDCCTWDGVTCDELTGNVIGIDLSCSELQGKFYSNSSLFNLSHLQRLNLAYNDFTLSHIPHEVSRFARLTHLNLSCSNFSGQIPSEISHLSKLVSLDLSTWNYFMRLRLESNNFKALLQNLTQLKELSLDKVNISSTVPMNFSSSLRTISFVDTGLYGKFPDRIFHLPNLQILDLSQNFQLTGHLLKFNWSCSTSLMGLDLSETGFSGELPHSIGYLNSINYLALSGCEFSGSLPESLRNLTEITTLYLSRNNFSGQIPDIFANLRKLSNLGLGENNFVGLLPSSISNLTLLSVLELRSLSTISLSSNRTIPSCLYNLSLLKILDVSHNRLRGPIHEFKSNSLEVIDFSNNDLHGPIPQSIFKQVNLQILRLASNNLSGSVELDMFSNLEQLYELDLSHNSLLVSNTNSSVGITLPNLKVLRLSSCNMKEIPDILRSMTNLWELDLSNNRIHGHGQIPSSLLSLNLSHNLLTSIDNPLPWKNMQFIDLSFNLLEGPLFVPPIKTNKLFVAHNKFTGEMSSSICNLSSLEMFDVSHNNLSGMIPKCLGNFSSSLSVLNLGMNSFQGTIPNTFAKANRLKSLSLNGNQLDGQVPMSLANCRKLEVFDLGNNKINDTFPHWLASLPELQVLILKSNKFHGHIEVTTLETKHPFNKLRVFDLSHNNFCGLLPEAYFNNFEAMKNRGTKKMGLEYMGSYYYKDSIVVTIKGHEYELVRILTIFTTIDLSCNKFEGKIPEFIGNLNSLRLLNLAYNHLTGQIPWQLKNVKALESLDLSTNRLTGKIPKQLTALTFLGFLNLSWNHLEGRIPRGAQFETFGNDSYWGNGALCGFPLSKNCGDNEILHPISPMVVEQEDNAVFGNGFNWKIVTMGYCCGMIFGYVLGHVMFLYGKPKWLVKIIEVKCPKKVRTRRNRS